MIRLYRQSSGMYAYVPAVGSARKPGPSSDPRGGRTCFNFHVTIMRNVECNYQPGELCSDASTILAKILLESLLLD